jgi:hypothetical protein
MAMTGYREYLTSAAHGRFVMATDPNGCLRCGTTLHSIGIEQFRVGGTSGGWKLLFGEWAEVSEEMLSLDVLACPKCRKVEMRVPSDS